MRRNGFGLFSRPAPRGWGIAGSPRAWGYRRPRCGVGCAGRPIGWRRFGSGSCGWPWRDVLAAVATATAAIRFRFGPAGLLGTVTPERVVVAASGGRLLAPGWPPLPDRGDATPVAPAAAHDDR